MRSALDTVIDFEVTPNRPDWLGVVGIARDLAAKGVGKFKLPNRARPGQVPCPVNVRIEAPEACPVFAGRLIRGVKNGPSPDWMQKRLKAIGINPKNMLVDVTNYISIDRCRPLHVYDAKKLKGGIVARLGTANDTFAALDGKTYSNLADMCVIADDSGAIGLGGVMGGEAPAARSTPSMSSSRAPISTPTARPAPAAPPASSPTPASATSAASIRTPASTASSWRPS